MNEKLTMKKSNLKRRNSKFVKLGTIAKICSGGTPSRTNPAYWNGSIPWIKTTQIQNCLITEDSVDECITEEGLRHSSARMVPKGTILMAMYGQGKTRGQVAILGIDASINQACAAILTENKVKRDFLFQQLLYRYKAIRAFSNTGSQENLNAYLIREFEILLPSLPEQTAIADLLSIWDAAIEKIERLIEAKEKSYDAFSVELLFGNNKSRTGKKSVKWFSVPKHWEIIATGAVAAEVNETNTAGEKISVLSCTKHEGLVDSLQYFDKQIFSNDLSKYKVVKNGQFAYATNHIEEGSIGYQNLYRKGLVSPIYIVFQTNNRINDVYLYKVFKTKLYRHIFRVNTSASVNRRGSLRWKEFAALPIPLPPFQEQQEIANLLEDARREIDLLKQQAEAYRKQKRGLMQKLLTGQWRVKGNPNGVN